MYPKMIFTKKTMAGITEEEAYYWDDYYTKNPPKPGPNETGFFTQRKAALSITVDSENTNYRIKEKENKKYE